MLPMAKALIIAAIRIAVRKAAALITTQTMPKETVQNTIRGASLSASRSFSNMD